MKNNYSEILWLGLLLGLNLIFSLFLVLGTNTPHLSGEADAGFNYYYILFILQLGITAILIVNILLPLNKIFRVAGIMAQGNMETVFKMKQTGMLVKLGTALEQIRENQRNKIQWYESILDSIPYPISVTDMDMNWSFINKKVEGLINRKRDDILGKQCDNWQTAACNSESCPLDRLKKGKEQLNLDLYGLKFKAAANFIYDREGNRVGMMEVLADVTSLSSILDYMSSEIQRLSNDFNQLAEGDLTIQPVIGQGDQYTEKARQSFLDLNSAFVASLNALNVQMEQVTMAADQVTLGAQQMSTASQDIAQGSSKQAGSIEQVSSSMQEMNAMTGQNSATAKEALQLSTMVREATQKSIESMDKLSQAIHQIKKSSDETSAIIKTIDEIAFQTNLLALNAAVEAARAGEAGKGFAVVAEEVRNLAVRSADAARDTSGMIEESIHNSNNGVTLNKQVSDLLTELIGQVNKVEELIREIASASDQQSQGINHVNLSIDQINQVTQQNSSNAEETASVAEELTSQAEHMFEMISKFRLKSDVAGKDPVNRHKVSATALVR